MNVRMKASAILVALSFAQAIPAGAAGGPRSLEAPRAVSATRFQTAAQETAPVLLTASELQGLLPATVYFRGKSAPVQLRNAAGVRFGADGLVLAAMVDTSGYASSVQERYQMYLITEIAVTIGSGHLSPGAYGAGVVDGKLIVMDIGGHTLFSADAVLDQAMARPRPLQLVPGPHGEVKLYLGRLWIAMMAAATP